MPESLSHAGAFRAFPAFVDLVPIATGIVIEARSVWNDLFSAHAKADGCR
jgi:hypothetical protein